MKTEELTKRLAAPAQRAINGLQLTSLDELCNYSEQEISGLHGIGKNAISIIKAFLHENNLSLK